MGTLPKNEWQSNNNVKNEMAEIYKKQKQEWGA